MKMDKRKTNGRRLVEAGLKGMLVAPLLAGTLMLPASAKADEAAVPARSRIETFGCVKAGVRSYGGGANPGIFAGVEAGASRGAISWGVTASGVKEKISSGLEEGSVWVSSSGKAFRLTGYVYEDRFLGVTEPTSGLNASRAGVTLGGEHGKTASAAYANYSVGEVTFGITAVVWDGTVQLVNGKAVVECKLGKVKGTLEAMHVQPAHGGNGSLQVRFTAKR